ncbi:unnamed protein product [Symbiodinium sp. CCMP2592]|nr:unnamed protein product [Symbiodinium sp. CCMP2592]
MGKEAKFMLHVVGQGSAGDPQFAVRDEIVSMLLLCRPAYLLHLLHLAITNPRTVDPSFVLFEDMKPGATKLLHSIIKHLADACQAMGNSKPTQAAATDTAEPETMQAQLTKYIMRIEAQFAFSHGPSATVEWPQMWAKILTVAVQRGMKPVFGAVDFESEQDKDKKDEDDATSKMDQIVEANLIKWLPSVKSVCPKNKNARGASLPFVRGDPQSPTTAKVKSEPTESTEPQASKGDADAPSGTVAGKPQAEQCLMPTFNEIYLMHDLPDIKVHDVDVRDVVAIRSQIELFIMSWAKQNSSSELLSALVVDAKGNTLMPEAVVNASMESTTLWGFGTVSTEPGSKSLKVARCNFGNNAVPVDYFLHYEGFSKPTSLVPCAVWMIKAGFEEKKAMFASQIEDMVRDFSDASGNKVTVHLQMPALRFRPEAVKKLVAAKETGTSTVSEHLCSRTSFSHEKSGPQRSTAGKFKTKSAQVLGGQAFKTMTGVVKTEAEGHDEDDGLGALLMTLNAPKHCKFLLR